MKQLYILLGVCGAGWIGAQDYHLSHYDITGLYFNPATTGFVAPAKADYRVTFDQRSQWRALGIKPFSTSYFSYDKPQTIKGRSVGLGGYLVNNSAGFANFNTFSAMLSASYDLLNAPGRHVSQTYATNHILTID